MVEHSNIDPEIEGLNPAAAKSHKKMGGKAIAGACILKLISAVIYGFRNKLECFFPGKAFQSSLVFSDKHSSLLQKL